MRAVHHGRSIDVGTIGLQGQGHGTPFRMKTEGDFSIDRCRCTTGVRSDNHCFFPTVTGSDRKETRRTTSRRVTRKWRNNTHVLPGFHVGDHGITVLVKRCDGNVNGGCARSIGHVKRIAVVVVDDERRGWGGHHKIIVESTRTATASQTHRTIFVILSIVVFVGKQRGGRCVRGPTKYRKMTPRHASR